MILITSYKKNWILPPNRLSMSSPSCDRPLPIKPFNHYIPNIWSWKNDHIELTTSKKVPPSYNISNIFDVIKFYKSHLSMTFICSNLIDFQYLALLILAIVLTRIHFRFYLGCNVSIFPLVLHEQCRNRKVFSCFDRLSFRLSIRPDFFSYRRWSIKGFSFHDIWTAGYICRAGKSCCTIESKGKRSKIIIIDFGKWDWWMIPSPMINGRWYFYVGNLNFKQEEKLFRFLFYKGILKPSNYLLKRGDI